MRLKMTGRHTPKSGRLDGYRVRIRVHLKHLVAASPPKFYFPAKYDEKAWEPKIKSPKSEFRISLGTRNLMLYEERLILAHQQLKAWERRMGGGTDPLQPYQISSFAKEIFDFYGEVVSDPRWKVDSISALHSFHRRMYEVTQGVNIDSRDEYHEFRGILPFAETNSFNRFLELICDFSEKEMDPLYKLTEYRREDPSKEAIIYRTAAITRWWLALRGHRLSGDDTWAVMQALDQIISVSKYKGFVQTGTADFLPPQKEASPDLSGLSTLDVYLQWIAERKPSKNTRRLYSKHVRDFNNFVEGKDISLITRYDVVKWKDKLLEPGGTVTPQTVRDNHLKALSSVFSYAQMNTYIKINVLREPLIKVPKIIGRDIQPYSDREIGAILSRAQEFDTTHRHRWIAWLLAATGARIGEITSLLPDQIVSEYGHWIIKIRPSGDGATVKNEGSVRDVPIHQRIIDDGFIDYVKGRKSLPLFYRPRPIDPNGRHPSEGPSETHGSWIRSLKNDGIDFTRKSSNHSIRHWFTTHQAEIGVQGSITARIQGHRIVGMQEAYIGRRLIEAMAKAINLIDFHHLMKRDV